MYIIFRYFPKCPVRFYIFIDMLFIDLQTSHHSYYGQSKEAFKNLQLCSLTTC